MNSQKPTSEHASQPPARRPYSAPRLTEYGPVSKLTRTGKGTIFEGTTPNSSMACL